MINPCYIHNITKYKLICTVVNNTMDTTMVKDTLEGINGIGSLQVTYSGNCYRHSWTVTFASNPGRQPLMKVAENNITGVNARIYINKYRDGHYLFDPIPGDMLNTVHIVPQVCKLRSLESLLRLMSCNFVNTCRMHMFDRCSVTF